MKRIIVFLLFSVILFPSFWHVYFRGMRDGEAAYKRSGRFAMALDSAYRFGVMDGCGGKK